MRMRNLLELHREFDRAFREAASWQDAPPARASYVPPVDITQSAAAYTVRVDLPGVARDQARVTVDEGAIVVSGVAEPARAADATVLRGERLYGRFSRLIPLPSDADLDAVHATFRQGVLEVRVSRKLRRPGQRVEIAVE